MRMRLDKMLAASGLYTRREAKQLISSGAVTVRGHARVPPEMKIDPEMDEVFVFNEKFRYRKHVYLMLHKPEGLVTASRDRAQKTVMSCLPEEYCKMGVLPVGRLDRDTTGLLLLTNDGDFAHKVISPRAGVKKVYDVRTAEPMDAEDIKAFAAGLMLRDGTKLRPALLLPLPPSGDYNVRIILTEGKYHQVKRMVASRDNKVLALIRVRLGTLSLPEDLTPGDYRELTDAELNQIFDTKP